MNTVFTSHKNYLYHVAAVFGGILAIFLFAGAAGHLFAVLPIEAANNEISFWLLTPSIFLLSGAAANMLLIRPLWREYILACRLSTTANILLAIYISWLMTQEMGGHPIGFFLAFVSSQLIVLVGILLGLKWPVAVNVDQEA